MRISKKITLAALCAFTSLVPAIGMGQTNDCQMIAETDSEFGTLAQDVHLYVPEAAGMVICKGDGSAASMVSLYLVTRITTTHSVRAYRFEIPYLYRTRFPAVSGLQKYLFDDGNGQAIQFICLIRSQCDELFSVGFAIIDEDIDEIHYPELVDIWRRADIERQILSFQGAIEEDADELKKFVRSGGVILPLVMSLDTYDGNFEKLFTWVYGLGGDGKQKKWSVDFEMRQDKLSIVGVSLIEVD